ATVGFLKLDPPPRTSKPHTAPASQRRTVTPVPPFRSLAWPTRIPGTFTIAPAKRAEVNTRPPVPAIPRSSRPQPVERLWKTGGNCTEEAVERMWMGGRGRRPSDESGEV